MKSWIDKILRRFGYRHTAIGNAPIDPASPSAVRLVLFAFRPVRLELWTADGNVKVQGQIAGPLPESIDVGEPIPAADGNLVISVKRFTFMQHDEETVVYAQLAEPNKTEE